MGLVVANVAELASPPSVPKPVVRTPEPDQVRRMLATTAKVDPRVRRLHPVGRGDRRPAGRDLRAALGRRGWDTGDIIVRRRVSRTESTPVLVDLTKTRKTRAVPVDQGTLEALRSFHASLVERAELCGVTLHRDAHLLSSSADGTVFWQPASVSRRFRTILHRHGLEHVTLYSLRHQAATVMIDANTVSERLGNSVTTVLTTYTRARTAADRAAADLMGSIYDT